MISITGRAIRVTVAIAGAAALGTGLAGAAAALPAAPELPSVVNVEPTPQEAVATAAELPNGVSADVADVPVLPPPDIASMVPSAADAPTLAQSLADQALAG
jgi:hypothetical protein